MANIFLFPLFESEGEKCFCVTKDIIQILRRLGEEKIYYFGKLFWRIYGPDEGAERLLEIVDATSGDYTDVAVVAEWKFLDHLCTVRNSNNALPKEYSTYIDELGCAPVIIPTEVDTYIGKDEGWGTVVCPHWTEEVLLTDTPKPSRYLDPALEEKIIKIKNLPALETNLNFNGRFVKFSICYN